jgi:hypothetical protein
MAYFKDLPNYPDERGSLTIIDDAKSKLPFDVERIFFIYNTTELPRGGHRHHRTQEAVICIQGNFVITTHIDGQPSKDYILNSPDKCLIIEPQEWRTLHSFSADAVILVLASYRYDPTDYVYRRSKISKAP